MGNYQVIECRTREEWLANRRHGIGSSDAPAVLGVSPFASALSVYADKIGITPLSGEETEAQKWGRIHEPHIIEEFAKEAGRNCIANAVPGSEVVTLIKSTVHPFMMSTQDATQVDPKRDWKQGSGVLEVKATGYLGDDWDDGVPLHVRVQMQHQMSVSGDLWGSAAVLIRGCKLLWADVERDDKFIDEVLIPAEEEFWRRVQSHEPVDPDGSESARKALRLMYPRDTGEVVALPGELIELDQERGELKRAEKDLVARIKFIDQRIIAAIGAASAGTLASGVTYTYKNQERDAYTIPATSFRVLRRSQPKAER